ARHLVAARNQVEERRLARAVRADDGVALALAHRQRDVLDDARRAEALVHAAQLEGECHASPERRPSWIASQRAPACRAAARSAARPAASTAANASHDGALRASNATPSTWSVVLAPGSERR